jgi:ABC-type Fe3+-hydroxamate transport system substrate-binding protein
LIILVTALNVLHEDSMRSVASGTRLKAGIRRRVKLSLPALLAFTLMAVHSPVVVASDRFVTDDQGFRVEIKNDVRRIVSLVPTNSEMVCLLDCSRLVGGTRYDRFPEELVLRIREKRLEVIGGGFDASLEKIVQIAPDLILVNGPSQQKVALPLKKMGYPVWSVWPRDLHRLKRDFLLLGEILAQAVKAKKILNEVEQGLAAIEQRAKGNPKKRVYLQVASDPLITVGKNSFPHWLISEAGGINIFRDVILDSTQVSLESIIARDPEVAIFLTGQENFVKEKLGRPEWKAIRAVQRSQICFVDSADIRRSVQFLAGLTKIQSCLLRDKPTGPAASAEAR